MTEAASDRARLKRSAEYEARKARSTAQQREQSRAGRDIGPLPAVANPARKESCRLDLRKWLDTYFPQPLPWSRNHLKVIETAQRVILEGGQFGIAMPRGAGKTTLCELACLWAVSYGHRVFPVLIGATADDAADRLDTNMGRMESEGAFADDFPEVCYPIQQLEGIAHRCAGQLLDGERTRITWTQYEIVLPTVPGSGASGAAFKVRGIEGQIRGLKVRRAGAEPIRPDLVIIDDPQTHASAKSVSQCQAREEIIQGDILGLAGPDKSIAALMPCTVIRPGDVVDNLLDRQKHPEWNGVRCRMLESLPTNTKLWDQYDEIRRESLRTQGNIAAATEFYRANRVAMDEGAEASWPERFVVGVEISAVQHAMNLKLRDNRSFWAEYQNEPLPATNLQDRGILTADQIASRLNGLPFGVAPLAATHLTAFVDVSQKVLWWMVCAWDELTFTGWIIAYGAYPDQQRDYFTLADTQRTLADVTKATGIEGAVLAGLESLVGTLLVADWRREDGSPMRIQRCLIDANWPKCRETVKTFCRRSEHAAVLLPSRGQTPRPGAKQIGEWKKRPGDSTGPGWHLAAATKGGDQRRIIFDPNEWKSFVHERLAISVGDVGSVSLFGRDPAKHRMLAEQLTAEKPEVLKTSSGECVQWKEVTVGRDNHLLDGLVGCAVAASTVGVRLVGHDPAGQRKQTKRVSYHGQQGAA